MPADARQRAALQSTLYTARKRNRIARAAASPVGEDRERPLIDNNIDTPIDNPDQE